MQVRFYGQINPDWVCLQANQMLSSLETDNLILFVLDYCAVRSEGTTAKDTISELLGSSLGIAWLAYLGTTLE